MPFDIEIENPWKNRDAIPYPKIAKLIPIALIYLLAGLVPIFFGDEQSALLAYIGLCVGVIYVLRMPRIAISVLLASFIPVAFLGSFSLGAMILAIVAGTACGAVLLTATRAPWRTVILPLSAWVIAYVITKDAMLSSLTLITLPASLLLALATVTGQRRTTAICYTIGGFLVTVLVLLGVYFWATYASLSRDTIVSHFETQREWIVGILLQYRDDLLKILAEQGAQGSEVYATMESLLSREVLASLVAMVYNLLPALVIVACSILAYEAQSLLCGAYCNLGMKSMLTTASVSFTMSVVSAIIYLAAFLLTSVLPADGLFSAVMQNFYLILTPGLFLIGWGALSFRFRTTKGGSKIFLILLLAFVLIFSPAAIFSLLAFFGAITVIISALGTRMIKKMQDQMSQNGGTAFGERMPHEKSDRGTSKETPEKAEEETSESGEDQDASCEDHEDTDEPQEEDDKNE